jgi:DNA-binding SARP family transcriptional activator
MRVDIKVLGPLEVSVAGASVVPTANKPSQLLAMLALNAGHVVTISTLLEEIWGSCPPRSAVPTLHTYVLQLRKKIQQALEAGGHRSPRDVLITRRCGYVLDVAPDDVDATRYQELSAQGHDAADRDDHQGAAAKLAAALRLWRGQAFADIAVGSQLRVETTRLEEIRLSDLDLRIETDLRLGRHHQLIGELATLCARYPLHENFYSLYMLALYRSGRQGQALEAYQRVRTLTVANLGVDPSPPLRRLQRAILRGDPAVEDPNYTSASTAWQQPTSLAG